MSRAVQLLLVGTGAAALVAGLWLVPTLLPPSQAAGLSRRELLVGLLALGALAMAALGFDLRDWI